MIILKTPALWISPTFKVSDAAQLDPEDPEFWIVIGSGIHFVVKVSVVNARRTANHKGCAVLRGGSSGRMTVCASSTQSSS
jgi:hypothetical protein